MSATYNWAYRPGVTNKYGFTVPASADNIRPTGWCYVALYGNDSTGNGSRQYPFRTITKACATVPGRFYVVLASGIYREATTIPEVSGGVTFVGDGNVIIDTTYNERFYNGGGNNMGIGYNLKIKGDGNSVFQGTHYSCNFEDCIFDGCTLSVNYSVVNHGAKNCVFTNITSQLYLNNPIFENCTIANCSNVFIISQSNSKLRSCIFKKCNISADTNFWGKISYSLFYQCNYKFTATGTGGAQFPSIPSGYTYFSTIDTLQAAYNTATGLSACYGSKIADPGFNNENIGDFTLAFNSPAKNLSFFGTYVGAKSIGYSVKVNTSENIGGFELASAVNVLIANDSITLINPSIDAQIDTKVIVNIEGRELLNLSVFGFCSDRNGQYIDSMSDLSAVTKTTNDILTIPSSYLVEVGSIVYNGATYTTGGRLTTVSGQTNFTTNTGGVLREILEAPQRHTVLARFSNGNNYVLAGEALIIGYYYFVQNDSIVYNGTTYSSGDTFKSINTNSFSGIGVVIIAFSNESFQHYELGVKPTSNNIDNLRSGLILRGNGDSAYVRGGIGSQEFTINAKFIQIRCVIRVNNLKP